MLVEEPFQGFVTVLSAVCRLGCGDREGPEDAGVAVRQRAVLQFGAMEVGEADQQVVTVGPGQPGFPDGQGVPEIEAVTGVVGGGHGQEISETIVADGRGEDELKTVAASLGSGPAAGGDVGPAVGAWPRTDGEDPQAWYCLASRRSEAVIADRDRMAGEEAADMGLDACCRSPAALALEHGEEDLTAARAPCRTQKAFDGPDADAAPSPA